MTRGEDDKPAPLTTTDLMPLLNNKTINPLQSLQKRQDLIDKKKKTKTMHIQKWEKHMCLGESDVRTVDFDTCGFLRGRRKRRSAREAPLCCHTGYNLGSGNTHRPTAGFPLNKRTSAKKS